MMFRTQYSERKRFFADPGSRVKVTYTGKIDDRGKLTLVETGKLDTYAEIQSYKDSVDINVILKRFSQGDANALNKVQGIYGDFTEMPKTYADMLNLVIGGSEKFEALPLEVKQKFNNNFYEFAASAGSGEWLEKLGYKQPAAPASAAPAPVQSSESPSESEVK